MRSSTWVETLHSLLYAMLLLGRLCWIDNIPSNPPLSQLIQFPSLRSLTICEHDIDDTEHDSLPKLCVPSFNSIEIVGDIIDMHSFLSMLQRSKCTIEQLHLVDSPLHFFLGISNELHDLEELSLSLTVNGNVLDSLVWNTTHFLPPLRKLEVRKGPWCCCFRIGNNYAFSVIRLRSGQGSKIIPCSSVVSQIHCRKTRP
ncbi:hypothetical protein BDQ17DRAFT_410895 [Cyathus striatus]|nr:hypothetical protein BDQ17DRAFT_410895 [Cyathus striatus]